VLRVALDLPLARHHGRGRPVCQLGGASPVVSWARRPLLLTGAEPHTLGTDTAANHTSQDMCGGGCTWATISLADGQARRHWPCLSLRARAPNRCAASKLAAAAAAHAAAGVATAHQHRAAPSRSAAARYWPRLVRPRPACRWPSGLGFPAPPSSNFWPSRPVNC
jgi:hypothetical protein